MLRTICRLRSPLSLTPINPSSSSLTATRVVASQVPPFFSYFSSSPVLQRRQLNHSEDEFNRDPDGPPRLFVIQPRIRPETSLKAKLEEALNLANSLEQQRDGFYETEFLDKEMPPHLVVQNPAARSPRAAANCAAAIEMRISARAWGRPVLDRVGLIIEIFNAHAQTKEAKLQVELAALMYKRSRLVRVRGPDGRYTFGGIGEAEVVSARGRGSGGRGFISGAGETELQLQRRRILDRRRKLLSDIEEVRRTRAMQRAARKRQGGTLGQEIATVAVVGYTNAGKSTLVSALSNNHLYCDDRLFATVDPKLSSVILPSGRKVLLSDTVGFISDLPVQLVEAFHATLEEVVEADLLVHVLDSSAPNIDEHRETVMQVLGRIGVSEEKLQNMIEVWNKVDLLQKEFDPGEIGDGDYGSGFSGEEDAELTRQDDYDQNIEAEPSGDVEDAIYHEHVEDSDDWLSCEDEQDSWVEYDGLSIGCEIVNGQQSEFSRDWRPAVKSSQSQSESNGHVKTSAVTGVGLQELLELIDEKLGPSQVVERSIFDRKWRPPRREDDEVAVEQ
ncbi:UNVERIFIED_CONTAM: GTP-binding protein, chloroplastic [Sesamum radiatum]|uniref:GTP-binding protein, chloroplastic n=1 Tax=Sesamum radiatum TaxID=300843 RepID=A0AAW2RCD6_SESRA